MMRLGYGLRRSPWLALAVCCLLLANDEQDRFAWVQADTVFGNEGRKAALAFASKRKGPDTEQLRAYLARAKHQPKERAVLNEVLSLFHDGKRADVVALLAPLAIPTESLLDARIWRLKAYSLEATGKPEETLQAAREWNAIAARLGWLRGQYEALKLMEGIFEQRRTKADLADILGKLAVVEDKRGNAREACLARTNQAAYYTELGRIRDALAALPPARTIPQTRSWLPFSAVGHEVRATAHWHRGEFAKALYEAERAHEIWSELNHAGGQANSAMLLGVIHQELGDFTAAESRFKAVGKSIGEGQSLIHAQLKGNLGNVAWRQARYDEAIELLKKAKADFKRLASDADVAGACKDIGEVLIDVGQPDAAIAFLEQAIQRTQSDPLAHADALTALAQAFTESGQMEKGLTTLDRARKVEGTQWDRRTRMRLCQIEAQILLTQDRPREAVAATRVAMDLMEDTLSGLADDQAFAARNQRGKLFQIAIECAFRTGDPATILECLERSRAVVLREAMGNRSALLAVGQPDELSVELEEARQRFVEARIQLQLALKGTKRAPVEEARAALVAAGNTLQEYAGRADRERKRRAGLLPVPPVSLGELRARIRADEAFVIYALDAVHARALVVTKKKATPVDLGDAGAIRSACERASRAYRDGEVDKSREQLQQLLVSPVLRDPACKHVIVCPDAELSYLPWPDLFDGRYASNAPSATTLAMLRREKGSSSERILAVGAVDCSESTHSPAGEVTRGPRLVPLIHSRAEVTAIVRGDKQNVALMAKNATEAKIREALAGPNNWSAIHFACHGVVDHRFPRRSALVLTPSGSDDGWLTVPEILSLDVSADLVVLSACESGSGAFLQGEGVVGLARAFLAAGAPRVLASLWKVDDEATKELMTHFYKRRALHDGPAAALRFAQAELKDSDRWSHPRFWAAWVIWGIPD